ncbi:MAG: hypothetical protein LUQ56_03400 [Methylococcaceae bacterium]|nr:hypothetical protein [Methylococcaceae bacterium]MDD1637165.1 hypothetical protein [Methylococcaceae bacterium]MDD1644116.1 hypothetical protein [Methylococcaceae bacterium]
MTKQIIADQGSDIKMHPAFSCQTSRGHAIPDLAHKIACMVKLLLSSDNVFQSFKAQFSQTRAAFQQSELNFFKPPNQRSKARYYHIAPRMVWAQLCCITDSMVIFT